MNTIPAIARALRNHPWRALPFVTIAGGGLLVLMLPAGKFADAPLYLVQAAVFFMLYQASSAATRLAQTAQVLAQRRLPVAQWTGSVRQMLASTWANCGALLAALAVQWLSDGAGFGMMLTGVAALSLAACAGTLFSALQSGLLPRLPVRALTIGSAGFMVAFFLYGHRVLAGASALAPAGLLLPALAWPVMALALRRHWQCMPALPEPVKADARGVPSLLQQMSRRIYLQPRFHHGSQWKSSAISGLQAGTAAIFIMMREPLAPGDTLSVAHLLSLVGLLPMAMSIVNLRDFHWRTMLLPGSSVTQTLAFNIYQGTLKVVAIILLCMMAGLALADTLLLGYSWSAVVPKLTQWLILAVEAPLVVATAVLVMALPRPHIATACSFIAAFSVFIASLLGKLQSVPMPGVQAGAAYAAGMLALAAMVMLAASRLWTPRRLLPYLPERPTGAAFSAAR